MCVIVIVCANLLNHLHIVTVYCMNLEYLNAIKVIKTNKVLVFTTTFFVSLLLLGNFIELPVVPKVIQKYIRWMMIATCYMVTHFVLLQFSYKQLHF